MQILKYKMVCIGNQRKHMVIAHLGRRLRNHRFLCAHIQIVAVFFRLALYFNVV